ncbi:hypothetical protein DdX_01739 [Ditylenchus destructor]|uniref:Uncharacterized protein n=1 Tax=Ditylenchus destructor TaxID=166010 RepID=A0AAD4NJC2_9BILA|nr:hypothetical protein DdX_01739 [Ditylenchus destructor]
MQAEPNNDSVLAVEKMMRGVNEDCRHDAEERRNRELQAFMKSQKKATEDMLRLHQRYLRKKEDDKSKNGKPQNVHHMFPAIITHSSPPERIQIKEELPHIPQKKIPQKRSNETSPDLVKGMCLPNAKEPTVNLQPRLQTPMTSLRMTTSSCAPLPLSLSQVTTPCAQFPTISHNQLQTSSVGAFVNYQGLPNPNHQPYQRIPYQTHAGVQQQNKGNCSGVFNSRVPDLYGLNQKNGMNPSQANYLQNGFGMTGSYNYLHNYHWMNQNAHSSLQPGSTIGNMGYSQFPNTQNSTKKNFPTPHSQPHNLNGNVDQLSFANNGYNGMTMGHQWNPPMPSMQNYYMNASSSAQVPQQISQIQERKSQHYNGHQSLPQNFVTNPAAGPSPTNSSSSHGGPPSATQSVHGDYSPSSSSGHTPGNPSSASLMPFNPTNVDGSQKRQNEQGSLPQSSNQCSGSNWANNYGALDSCYMMNMGINNVNNFASEEIRNELNVYLGPGHCDFQTDTPMPSNAFAGHHSNYYGYSGNPVYDQLK